MVKKFIIVFGLILSSSIVLLAQVSNCDAFWRNDTLILKNEVIEQKMIWQNGELHNYSIAMAGENNELLFENKKPSVSIFDQKPEDVNKNLELFKIEDHYLYPDHLQAHVITRYPDITIKRVFKIYPDATAIACQYFFKNIKIEVDKAIKQRLADGVEDENEKSATDLKFHSYGLKNRHWKIDYISFQDVTDDYNNLVKENHLIPYRVSRPLVANLIFASDQLTEQQFFILKESPLHHNQVNYPGADFLVSNQEVSITGMGIPFEPVQDWIVGYTITTGYTDVNSNPLVSLRQYLKASRPYGSQHEMILMNTWGDRGRDGKINEAFALREIEACRKMGLTHLQLDDGWQQGLSKNSSSSAGKLWSEWPEGSWEPNPERFPKGLDHTVDVARKAGIKVGLWFNPTSLNSYVTWERDADILLHYYKKYGISVFKIDGLQLPDKTAEINVRKFFDKVMRESNGQVVFNPDVTAGRRCGYYFYDEFGNIFVENRYTDWANYYPYQTLRNLWQLAKYVAPEKLQFEFLNKWRNADKYQQNDIFAPAHYDFEYLFAITMMSQPLAWFEGSNLPSEAFEAAPAIKKYQEVMGDIHRGIILPIGEEPSGRSWTGFQSIKENQGYILVFREYNSKEQKNMKTQFPAGVQVKLTAISGQGKNFEAKVDRESCLLVELPAKNSYGLWKYEVK